MDDISLDEIWYVSSDDIWNIVPLDIFPESYHRLE